MHDKETEKGKPAQDLPAGGKANQEGRDWQGRPHKELVEECRNYIQDWQERTKGNWSPEYIIHRKLEHEWRSRSYDDEQLDETKQEFFFKIAHAWDAIAFSHYEPGSHEWHDAEFMLNTFAGDTEGGPVIKLTTQQARVIDVLTEAVGIPHKRGETNIEIPQQFQNFENYEKWLMSDERRELLARAEAKRKAG